MCKIFFVILACISASANASEQSPRLPRYRLQVGQELVYRGGGVVRSDSSKLVHCDSWRVWVVRKNPDQSCRLILQYGRGYTTYRLAPGDKEDEEDLSESPMFFKFAWCDFHPDGRIIENDSLGFLIQPSKLLVRLPRDEVEMKEGWKSRDARTDEIASLRMLAPRAPGHCSIEVVRESSWTAAYGSEDKQIVTFNLERALPEKVTVEMSTSYANQRGTGRFELTEVRYHPLDWCRKFSDEAERYFAAAAAYEKTRRRRDLKPEELKTELESAADELKTLGEAVETADLKIRIADDLADHRRDLDYNLERSAKRAAILGALSDDWTATDLEGKTHALKDYRGKVVILDFWYRACGWCIRAMPQVKDIAAHFQGQPVVLFGMNTDEKDDDAAFVVEKMSLNYPNLKASHLPEKYNVTSFPTLVILDQDGVIRDVHFGCSPTLRDDVVKSVEQLLNLKQ